MGRRREAHINRTVLHRHNNWVDESSDNQRDVKAWVWSDMRRHKSFNPVNRRRKEQIKRQWRPKKIEGNSAKTTNRKSERKVDVDESKIKKIEELCTGGKAEVRITSKHKQMLKIYAYIYLLHTNASGLLTADIKICTNGSMMNM